MGKMTMYQQRHGLFPHLSVWVSLLMLSACRAGTDTPSQANLSGFEVKMLVGSALKDFCTQAATQFNQQQPKLPDGKAFHLTCEAKGSGDVVTTILTLAEALKAGTVPATDPQFPTLVSVDGEIYQSQLRFQLSQLFPGQDYIPDITDSPLIANSPMVFMVPADLAPALQRAHPLYKALTTARTFQDLNPTSPPIPLNFVQTAPTRSNSGLQTLVAQFVEVSGKRPEQLTVADVNRYQSQVQKIQSKVTRYGVSTNALATAMVKNGPFWAAVGAVYESSVIAANTERPPEQTPYVAVYPPSTFASNMRGILPQAPWVSPEEKAAAEQVITFLRSPPAQQIATNLGLRPGVPGIPLGNKFTANFGVNPNVQYDSLRPPRPEVVAAMLKSWETYAKKPSLVVVVVDTSGSMQGNKMPAVQQTLQRYINNLGPKDQIALIDFDSEIRPPILADGSPQGRSRGLAFISSLEARGGTRLYDAALYARNWLQQHRRPDAINAVLILTDGEDSGSQVSLNQLGAELQKSGFSSDDRIAFFTVGYGQEGDFNPDALKKTCQLKWRLLL
ncbi:VWA domain-containing protein [Neosynechococcus sphagnicola]|uniref:VWA domain-containing protein n=1 Tax=Neosynechococcus sphagnicola TaxID=1501145 RepID=UPI001EFA03C7|nr:VWA domain-containing protein [Neosynechococcus sphagnicola]